LTLKFTNFDFVLTYKLSAFSSACQKHIHALCFGIKKLRMFNFGDVILISRLITANRVKPENMKSKHHA